MPMPQYFGNIPPTFQTLANQPVIPPVIPNHRTPSLPVIPPQPTIIVNPGEMINISGIDYLFLTLATLLEEEEWTVQYCTTYLKYHK